VPSCRATSFGPAGHKTMLPPAANGQGVGGGGGPHAHTHLPVPRCRRLRLRTPFSSGARRAAPARTGRPFPWTASCRWTTPCPGACLPPLAWAVSLGPGACPLGPGPCSLGSGPGFYRLGPPGACPLGPGRCSLGSELGFYPLGPGPWGLAWAWAMQDRQPGGAFALACRLERMQPCIPPHFTAFVKPLPPAPPPPAAAFAGWTPPGCRRCWRSASPAATCSCLCATGAASGARWPAAASP
jgi:hypothetical protein